MTDKLSPAEQARKEVEECFAERMELNEWPPDVVKWGLEQQKTLIDSLIARLTPVYERAQRFAEIVDALNPCRRNDAVWSLGRDLAAPGVAATQIEKTREKTDALRERAELLTAEAPVNRGAFIEYSGEKWWSDDALHAAEERAERAEVDGREWHELYTAEQDRREAAEADVKRLREALTFLQTAGPMRRYAGNAGPDGCIEPPSEEELCILCETKPCASGCEIREALAAPERKGDIITMTSDTVCVRLDCENFGKPLAGCPKPEERKPRRHPDCTCGFIGCDGRQCQCDGIAGKERKP